MSDNEISHPPPPPPSGSSPLPSVVSLADLIDDKKTPNKKRPGGDDISTTENKSKRARAVDDTANNLAAVTLQTPVPLDETLLPASAVKLYSELSGMIESKTLDGRNKVIYDRLFHGKVRVDPKQANHYYMKKLDYEKLLPFLPDEHKQPSSTTPLSRAALLDMMKTPSYNTFRCTIMHNLSLLYSKGFDFINHNIGFREYYRGIYRLVPTNQTLFDPSWYDHQVLETAHLQGTLTISSPPPSSSSSSSVSPPPPSLFPSKEIRAALSGNITNTIGVFIGDPKFNVAPGFPWYKQTVMVWSLDPKRFARLKRKMLKAAGGVDTREDGVENDDDGSDGDNEVDQQLELLEQSTEGINEARRLDGLCTVMVIEPPVTTDQKGVLVWGNSTRAKHHVLQLQDPIVLQRYVTLVLNNFYHVKQSSTNRAKEVNKLNGKPFKQWGVAPPKFIIEAVTENFLYQKSSKSSGSDFNPSIHLDARVLLHPWFDFMVIPTKKYYSGINSGGDSEEKSLINDNSFQLDGWSLSMSRLVPLSQRFQLLVFGERKVPSFTNGMSRVKYLGSMLTRPRFDRLFPDGAWTVFQTIENWLKNDEDGINNVSLICSRFLLFVLEQLSIRDTNLEPGWANIVTRSKTIVSHYSRDEFKGDTLMHFPADDMKQIFVDVIRGGGFKLTRRSLPEFLDPFVTLSDCVTYICYMTMIMMMTESSPMALVTSQSDIEPWYRFRFRYMTGLPMDINKSGGDVIPYLDEYLMNFVRSKGIAVPQVSLASMNITSKLIDYLLDTHSRTTKPSERKKKLPPIVLRRTQLDDLHESDIMLAVIAIVKNLLSKVYYPVSRESFENESNFTCGLIHVMAKAEADDSLLIQAAASHQKQNYSLDVATIENDKFAHQVNRLINEFSGIRINKSTGSNTHREIRQTLLDSFNSHAASLSSARDMFYLCLAWCVVVGVLNYNIRKHTKALPLRGVSTFVPMFRMAETNELKGNVFTAQLEGIVRSFDPKSRQVEIDSDDDVDDADDGTEDYEGKLEILQLKRGGEWVTGEGSDSDDSEDYEDDDEDDEDVIRAPRKVHRDVDGNANDVDSDDDVVNVPLVDWNDRKLNIESKVEAEPKDDSDSGDETENNNGSDTEFELEPSSDDDEVKISTVVKKRVFKDETESQRKKRESRKVLTPSERVYAVLYEVYQKEDPKKKLNRIKAMDNLLYLLHNDDPKNDQTDAAITTALSTAFINSLHITEALEKSNKLKFDDIKAVFKDKGLNRFKNLPLNKLTEIWNYFILPIAGLVPSSQLSEDIPLDTRHDTGAAVVREIIPYFHRGFVYRLVASFRNRVAKDLSSGELSVTTLESIRAKIGMMSMVSFDERRSFEAVLNDELLRILDTLIVDSKYNQRATKTTTWLQDRSLDSESLDPHIKVEVSPLIVVGAAEARIKRLENQPVKEVKPLILKNNHSWFIINQLGIMLWDMERNKSKDLFLRKKSETIAFLRQYMADIYRMYTSYYMDIPVIKRPPTSEDPRGTKLKLRKLLNQCVSDITEYIQVLITGTRTIKSSLKRKGKDPVITMYDEESKDVVIANAKIAIEFISSYFVNPFYYFTRAIVPVKFYKFITLADTIFKLKSLSSSSSSSPVPDVVELWNKCMEEKTVSVLDFKDQRWSTSNESKAPASTVIKTCVTFIQMNRQVKSVSSLTEADVNVPPPKGKKSRLVIEMVEFGKIDSRRPHKDNFNLFAVYQALFGKWFNELIKPGLEEWILKREITAEPTDTSARRIALVATGNLVCGYFNKDLLQHALNVYHLPVKGKSFTTDKNDENLRSFIRDVLLLDEINGTQVIKKEILSDSPNSNISIDALEERLLLIVLRQNSGLPFVDVIKDDLVKFKEDNKELLLKQKRRGMETILKRKRNERYGRLVRDFEEELEPEDEVRLMASVLKKEEVLLDEIVVGNEEYYTSAPFHVMIKRSFLCAMFEWIYSRIDPIVSKLISQSLINFEHFVIVMGAVKKLDGSGSDSKGMSLHLNEYHEKRTVSEFAKLMKSRTVVWWLKFKRSLKSTTSLMSSSSSSSSSSLVHDGMVQYRYGSNPLYRSTTANSYWIPNDPDDSKTPKPSFALERKSIDQLYADLSIQDSIDQPRDLAKRMLLQRSTYKYMLISRLYHIMSIYNPGMNTRLSPEDISLIYSISFIVKRNVIRNIGRLSYELYSSDAVTTKQVGLLGFDVKAYDAMLGISTFNEPELKDPFKYISGSNAINTSEAMNDELMNEPRLSWYSLMLRLLNGESSSSSSSSSSSPFSDIPDRVQLIIKRMRDLEHKLMTLRA